MSIAGILLPNVSVAILLRQKLDCEAVESLLTSRYGATVVGTTTKLDCLNDLCRRMRPDLAMVDASYPLSGGDIFSSVARLLDDSHVKHALFLDCLPNRTRAVRATSIYRTGYITRNRTAAQLTSAVNELLTGGVPLDGFTSEWLQNGRIANRRFTASPLLAQLTPREVEVLCLVAEGRSETECAELLNLSARTVNNHKARIMKRLGVRKAVHLTLIAIREGLIDP